MEAPPSKAMVKTQLKRNERALRGTISEGITDINRLGTQQMTQAQHHEAGPIFEELLMQVRVEYCGIVSKLEVTILSEEQASEEDATLLWMTEEFLARILAEASLI